MDPKTLFILLVRVSGFWFLLIAVLQVAPMVATKLGMLVGSSVYMAMFVVSSLFSLSFILGAKALSSWFYREEGIERAEAGNTGGMTMRGLYKLAVCIMGMSVIAGCITPGVELISLVASAEAPGFGVEFGPLKNGLEIISRILIFGAIIRWADRIVTVFPISDTSP